MTDIFISYASQDRERVLPFIAALDNAGWSIFWDRTIPPGETWRTYIGAALVEARCVVVIWTNASVKSDWVCEEAERAHKRGVLIPALLDDVDPPLGFGSVQAARLVDWDGAISAPAFEQLRRQLERRLSADAVHPASVEQEPVRWDAGDRGKDVPKKTVEQKKEPRSRVERLLLLYKPASRLALIWHGLFFTTVVMLGMFLPQVGSDPKDISTDVAAVVGLVLMAAVFNRFAVYEDRSLRE